MGVVVETIKPGDGVTYPKPGQTVTAHYTGASRENNKIEKLFTEARCSR